MVTDLIWIFASKLLATIKGGLSIVVVQGALLYFKSDLSKCKTNTELSQTWHDILCLIAETGHVISQKLLTDLQQLLLVLGDLGARVNGGTGDLRRHYSRTGDTCCFPCATCFLIAWNGYSIKFCRILNPWMFCWFPWRAHTTGNLSCHDSIDQYHTVVRTTTGVSFHPGFASCLNVATVICLFFSTELSLLAAGFAMHEWLLESQ